MKETVAVGLTVVLLSALAVREAVVVDRGPRDSMVATDAPRRTHAAGAGKMWDDTYRAALATGRWDRLVDAGNAYRRLGEVVGPAATFDAKAREAYLAAFARARQERSLEGVLGVAEALAALGDRESVERCLRIAELLAAQDPDAQADVRAFTVRVAGP
jgi:hypothetical protein